MHSTTRRGRASADLRSALLSTVAVSEGQALSDL
jgi:hypothetical protein